MKVDLLIEKHNKIAAACEIKSTHSVSGADLTGLQSFSQEHKDTPCYVISNARNSYEIKKITVLPWQVYLEKLNSIL